MCLGAMDECCRGCTERHVGCHDPETCARWREHLEKVEKYREHAAAERDGMQPVRISKRIIDRKSVGLKIKRGRRL